MKIGYHISINGGLSKTAKIIKEQHLSSVQIFPGSPRSYFPSKHSTSDLEDFTNLNIPKFVHSNYLINPAGDKEVIPKSIAENLFFCDKIGASGLVVHMGSNKNTVEGMELTRYNIQRGYELSGAETKLLIETTAEGGNRLKFDKILQFIEENKDLNIGLCIDSEHLYAAGYTSNEIVNIIEKHSNIIELIHLNNPNPEVIFGKHLDKHTISLWDESGKFSSIEIENFISISKLLDIPIILETGTPLDDFLFITENYQNF